jgi:hypothetical protein
MPARKTALKLAIYERYPSQRAFLADLENGKQSLELSESRLSKLITGHLEATAEERRIFAWRLQRSIAELFPEEECHGR